MERLALSYGTLSKNLPYFAQPNMVEKMHRQMNTVHNKNKIIFRLLVLRVFAYLVNKKYNFYLQCKITFLFYKNIDLE